MAQSQRIICEIICEFFPNPHVGTRNQIQNIRCSDTWLSHLSGPLKIDLFLILFCVYVRVGGVHAYGSLFACVYMGRADIGIRCFLNHIPPLMTFKIYLFYFVCMCLSLNICLCDKCLQNSQKDFESCGTEIAGGHELPVWGVVNPAQDLYKNSNSLTLSHISSPLPTDGSVIEPGSSCFSYTGWPLVPYDLLVSSFTTLYIVYHCVQLLCVW